MKLNKITLGVIVVAVTVVNAFVANNGVISKDADLTLSKLENTAEAVECEGEIISIVNGKPAGWKYVSCNAENDDVCNCAGLTEYTFYAYFAGQLLDFTFTCTGKPSCHD